MNDDAAKQAEIARKTEERKARVRQENDAAVAASRAKEKETAVLQEMTVESKEKLKAARAAARK